MTTPRPITVVDDYGIVQAAIVDATGAILCVIATSSSDVLALNTPPGCQAVSPPPPDQDYRWDGAQWTPLP